MVSEENYKEIILHMIQSYIALLVCTDSEKRTWNIMVRNNRIQEDVFQQPTRHDSNNPSPTKTNELDIKPKWKRKKKQIMCYCTIKHF